MGTIVRAAAAYALLWLVLRVGGRRSVNQLTPIEFILLFLVGGLMVQAIVQDDRSITNAFAGAVTLVLVHTASTFLRMRWSGAAKFFDGTPIVIVEEGHLREEWLARVKLQETDVMAAARARGLHRLEDVRYAIVERNGQIAIIPRS